ncbi:MAG: hypothetical protein WCI67_07540, partial [Chloroflexales bacterium]
ALAMLSGCAAPPPAAVPTPAPSVTAIPSTATKLPVGEPEILFLRGGDLTAYGVRTRAERTIARGVREFAATPDGALLAMLIGPGRSGEIWVARRDGSAARQITSNQRAEGDLSWAPDGSALAYSSADSDKPRDRTWEGWSRWCAVSEARVIELSDAQERTLAPGCEPAFGPDGKRIAFAAPPASKPSGQSFLGANNAVRLVNRQGQNGWSFAKANSQGTAQGNLVYAPAWTPSGDQIAYQRFMGYSALVDLNITEIGAAFKGAGQPLLSGAGWMLPARFRPDGRQAAVLEHNFSDARGGSGYEIWRLSVVRLGVAGSMFLPSGEVPTVGRIDWQAPRVTAAAWSPDGESLALALPAGWSRDDPAQDLIYQAEGAGEIWRWAADGTRQERLITNVDYASPLLWLP